MPSRRLLAHDAGLQLFGGEPTEVADRLTHRGQSRGDVPGGHHVIPAHDSQIVWEASSIVLKSFHDGQSKVVVGADEPVDLDTSSQDLVRDLDPGALK